MDAQRFSLAAILFLLVVYIFYIMAMKIQRSRSASENPNELQDKKASIHWDVDHWESEGSLKISALERITGVKFDSKIEPNTINGLFMQELNRVPNPGDEIIVNDLCFLALNVKKFRVGRVQINVVKPKK
jgi:CBS domain containing-hemolysin-like protein